MNPWQWLLDVIQQGLVALHQLFEPIAGAHAWGWAIIGLTAIIRILLVPIAVKQFRSMRAMQALAPEMQRIRKKYKVDRDLLKKDPEKYRDQRQKMNEEVMALYKDHGVNPAASCLPLLLQAPIFIALFRVLQDAGLELDGQRISQADFYVFGPLGEMARTDVWGWVLIALMVVSMFVAQKQMMGRNQASLEGMQAQQQKIMLYGMPVFLGFIAQNLPIGVLLYWVTTNVWQLAQQGLILREVQHDAPGAPSSNGSGRSTKGGGKKGAGTGGGSTPSRSTGGSGARTKGGGKKGAGTGGGSTSSRSTGGSGARTKGGRQSKRERPASPQPARPSTSDHLPRRQSGGRGTK